MNSFLNAADKEAFIFLNRGHNSFLDSAMFAGRDLLLWVPLVLLGVFTFYRYRCNRAKPHQLIKTGIFVIFSMCLILVSLAILPRIADALIQRERPLYNPEIRETVKLDQFHYPTTYDFFSAKVCAVLAISFFFAGFRQIPRWLKVSLTLWAFLICYNRIFIGAHYPLNIMASALTGALMGLFAYRYFLHLKNDVLVI